MVALTEALGVGAKLEVSQWGHVFERYLLSPTPPYSFWCFLAFVNRVDLPPPQHDVLHHDGMPLQKPRNNTSNDLALTTENMS